MLKVSKYAFVLESFLLKLKAYSVGEDLPKAIRILEQPRRTFYCAATAALNSLVFFEHIQYLPNNYLSKLNNRNTMIEKMIKIFRRKK